MVTRGDNSGFFKGRDGIKWRNIIFLFVFFIAVLFLDMFFLSFFTFNFFIPFSSHTDPLGEVCLSETFDAFLNESELLPLNPDLCDGFFNNYQNSEKCDTFYAYTDFCYYLFAIQSHDYFLCEPIESSIIKDRCFIDAPEVILDEI